MKQGKEVLIVSADADRSTEIKDFVLAMMSDLYPRGSYYENPHDLAFLKECTYSLRMQVFS